jgi:acetylornithine deacetylase
MNVADLLMNLVKIPSCSGSEGEIGGYIARRLKKNFKVQLQKVGNRFNIFAYIGNPKIILTSHLDTIPKQLEIKEDKDYIYGRGACDAKASLASMICAAEELAKIGISDFGLLFDVSEETDFSGIKKALDLVNPDFVIVGEPTNFKTVIGQKGLLGIKIKCYGKSAPGSTPEKGDSAIIKLIRILNLLQTPEKTSMNIGKISGGSAANVVPDYAEAIVEFRTLRKNNEVVEILRKQGIEFEIVYNFDPVFPNNLNLIKNLKSETEIVPYFTEMYFWAKKASTFVFGPGEYEYAHSDNERIRKEDLEKAALKYMKIITYIKKENLIKSRKEVED